MSQRRVVVTGVTGQLGSALLNLQVVGWDIVGTSSADLDIRHWPSVRDRFQSLNPDLVIHAAAATNVDRCERDPDWAFQANAVGTRHIARASAEVGSDLVYVSTNYVFDGTKPTPYHEFDPPHPINVYGASKLAGEHEARRATSRCHIVRTASVFSEGGHNFVRTMRGLMDRLDRITVVNDQVSNPTYAADLAIAIAQIVKSAPYGAYHATNAGIASWHEWATEIARLIGSTTKIAPIPATDFRRDATPPANGALESLTLPDLGIILPSWHDGLKRCLDRWQE